MSLIKGIGIGFSDITGTYKVLSDTERLNVIALDLAEYGNVLSIDDVIYTGNPHTPTPTVTAVVGGETVTLVKDRDYTLSYTNNTNAGQATVTITGLSPFTGTIEKKWNINPADITVVAQDQTYVYNHSEQGSGVVVSVVDSSTPTVKYRITSSGDYTLTSVPTRMDVGTTTVYYKVTAPNHNDNVGSYTLTITSLVAVLSWGETTWTYDGQGHSTTCIVSNLIPGDTCNVILGNNSITNIGSETITAIALSNTNYELPTDSTVSITITITPGLFIKLSGTWTPVKEVYKRVSGSWVKQDMTTAFSTSEAYVKKD